MPTFVQRVEQLAHNWNAFLDRTVQEPPGSYIREESSYGRRPDRVRLFITNERSFLIGVYVRMALDISMLSFRHIRVDDEDRYLEDYKSGLNNCLQVSANLDQSAFALKMDMVLSLFDRGDIAIVPIDTTSSPVNSNSYDILTMRVGKVLEYFPSKVLVEVYNETTGRTEQVKVLKKYAAIVENPLYPIMNEPNSTFQRLNRKLSMLDRVDEQNSSGKLDLIIQLPYTTKSDTRKRQARERRDEMEAQLTGSKYGVAYADATEKITQLNRPVENQLMTEITELKEELLNQLGVTKAIMDGSADEAAILNYQHRTVEPIATVLTQSMTRTFLTKTAMTQGQRLSFFMDRFKLATLKDMAEIADKFSRNEIFSANEFRQFMGYRPSSDPKADELRNSNMPRKDTELPPVSEPEPPAEPVTDKPVEPTEPN